MPRLMVIYDPTDRIEGLPTHIAKDRGILEAKLSIGENYEPEEIADIANRLSALLLEQMQ